MNGGDGAYSYTKNSQYQKQASDVVKGMIQDAVIHNLDAESISTTLTIADMGCSVGPNTFFTVQNLIQAVHNKCSLQGLHSKHLEFQVFFNDHSANDFNTLFASLPTEGPQYYAAGVPGSFHGRLFPRSSITLAHSSYAVQWLSKQPQGVANAGRIHYTGASAEVERAYLDQFKRDMGGFMGARAEEMVRGGLMFLIIPGIPDGVSHSGHPSGVLFHFLGESLMELAHEGVVDEGEIEAFNLPIYSPRVGEMREVIEKDGRFSIEKMELTNPKSVVGPIDVGSLIMHLRAGMEGVFTAHFGSSVVEKMFTNVSAKAQQISRFWEAVDTASTQLFIVLKRK